MLKVEETRVLTIDGNSIAVETLSPEVKELVAYYDHWKQEAMETRSKLLMAQHAMQSLAAQIAKAATEEPQKTDEDEDTTAAEISDSSGYNPDGE